MPGKNRITSSTQRGWAGTEESHCLIIKSIQQAGEGVRTLGSIHPNSRAAIREMLQGLGTDNKMGNHTWGWGKVHAESPVLSPVLSPAWVGAGQSGQKGSGEPSGKGILENLDGPQAVSRRKSVEAELCVGFHGRRKNSMKFLLPCHWG